MNRLSGVFFGLCLVAIGAGLIQLQVAYATTYPNCDNLLAGCAYQRVLCAYGEDCLPLFDPAKLCWDGPYLVTCAEYCPSSPCK